MLKRLWEGSKPWSRDPSARPKKGTGTSQCNSKPRTDNVSVSKRDFWLKEEREPVIRFSLWDRNPAKHVPHHCPPWSLPLIPDPDRIASGANLPFFCCPAYWCWPQTPLLQCEWFQGSKKNCSTLPGFCFSPHPSCVYFPVFSVSVCVFLFQQEQPDKMHKNARVKLAFSFSVGEKC